MKITQHILSIPPYLSTTWDQIVSLYVKETQLVVCLQDRSTISVPNLNPEEIELIFKGHAAFLDALSRAAQNFTPRFPHSNLPHLPPGYSPQTVSLPPGEEMIPLRL